MPELTQHYLKAAINSGERRIKLINQPLVPRSHIQCQDWILAGSLYALSQQGFTPEQPEEEPSTVFLYTWLLLKSQGQQALDTLADQFNTLSGHLECLSALSQALRCFTLDINESKPFNQASPAFLACLASNAQKLPTTLLEQWVNHTDDELKAAALERLIIYQPDRVGTLENYFTNSQLPLTRRKALTLASLHHNAQAIEALASLSDEDLEDISLALLAAWFHPDIYQHRGLKPHALTGQSSCIPALLDALEQPKQARTAEQAWLWLTGQRLAHKPPVTGVNTSSPSHTSPNPNTLPDVRIAREWWQKQNWDNNQRYFLGQPVTGKGLKQLYRDYTGQTASLICTHLGYSQGVSITEPYGLWLSNQGGSQ